MEICLDVGADMLEIRIVLLLQLIDVDLMMSASVNFGGGRGPAEAHALD